MRRAPPVANHGACKVPPPLTGPHATPRAVNNNSSRLDGPNLGDPCAAARRQVTRFMRHLYSFVRSSQNMKRGLRASQVYARRHARKQKQIEATLERTVRASMPLYAALSMSQLMVSTHQLEPGLPICEANSAMLTRLGIPSFVGYLYRHCLPDNQYNRLMAVAESANCGESKCLSYMLSFRQKNGSLKYCHVVATLCRLQDSVAIIACPKADSGTFTR
jgi:hypothetical protein